jgi:mitogen-activated protein kinase kinase kinase
MKAIDILLELVPGGSLKSILQKYGALELDVIRNYSKQLLLGLNYLHNNKIAHRDLKSANILISSNGILKLSDFGSSRKFEEFEGHISKSLRGSPYWMAPEVVKREGHNYPADIWSFGCVLIEMATGHPPWSNHSNEVKQVLYLISKENSYPDIPSSDLGLQSIITQCLVRIPKDRPTTEQLLAMPFFNIENE